MRAWAAYGALALNFLIAPVAAQQVTEAESHVVSAFTSRADPRVLAEDVKLGPTLRGELGAGTGSRRIYDALVERISGRPFRVNLLPPAEAARYASLVGGSLADPLVVLEAGDLALLMQYAAKEKQVVFVEQLSKPAPRTEPQLPPEALKPPPVVEVPLPPAPPAPEPPAPPPVAETPKPPVVMEKPKPPPVVEVPPPAPRPALVLPPPAPLAKPPAAAVQKPRPELRPRGECVIKPVMSEEDLWNCSAPTRPAALDALPPPVAAQKQQPPAAEAPKPRVECVIKPVMSEEDLRACATVSTSRSAPVVETPVPMVAVEKPPAPAAPPAPRECVIKPVMSEEDLRACASVSTPRAMPVVEKAAPPMVAVEKAPAPAAPPAQRECVIKPVMSEEDLRACAAVSTPRAAVPVETPAPPIAAEQAPSKPSAPRECVIRPVMSEEDLRACGVRR